MKIYMSNSSYTAQVIWITGLSGSGKTTIAQALRERLVSHGVTPVMIDGDMIREALGAEELLERAQREELALSYARLAKMFSDQGHVVICSTISLYASVHKWRYSNITCLTDVYLKVPFATLEKRNSKGLYSSKHESTMVGQGIAIEEPYEHCTTIENYGSMSPAKAVDIILDKIHRVSHDQ